jgi:hypothetical protein
MWKDDFWCNEAFVNYYPFFSLEQLNELELKFLEYMDYKSFISDETYQENYKVLQAFLRLDRNKSEQINNLSFHESKSNSDVKVYELKFI